LFVTACPIPDAVANAIPSTFLNPWLVGDVFSYVCQGQLVMHGTENNECSVSGNSAFWSLSSLQNNLPMCGKFIFWVGR